MAIRLATCVLDCNTEEKLIPKSAISLKQTFLALSPNSSGTEGENLAAVSLSIASAFSGSYSDLKPCSHLSGVFKTLP